MVKLVYFAWVRDATGVAEETVELPDNVATVADLAGWLATRDPVFSDHDRLRVAVDAVMAGFHTDIRCAKEIAFFPPVTGG